MIFKILLLLIAFPLLDLVLTARFGARLGVYLPLEIVFTFLLGIYLYRTKARPFLKALKGMGMGMAPGAASSLGEGLAYLLASILLIVPGFLTDLLGFMLLLPAVRRNLSQKLVPKALAGMIFGTPFGNPFSGAKAGGAKPGNGPFGQNPFGGSPFGGFPFGGASSGKDPGSAWPFGSAPGSMPGSRGGAGAGGSGSGKGAADENVDENAGDNRRRPNDGSAHRPSGGKEVRGRWRRVD